MKEAAAEAAAMDAHLCFEGRAALCRRRRPAMGPSASIPGRVGGLVPQ